MTAVCPAVLLDTCVLYPTYLRDTPLPAPRLAPEGSPPRGVHPGQAPTTAVLKALDRWIGWARRCRIDRIDSFVDLRRRIRRHHDAIRAALTTGMSNGLVEPTNTKTRLIIHRDFGFR